MVSFFFFNDTATTEIYTLSLHDALPISTTPTTFLGAVASVGTDPLLASVVTRPPRKRIRTSKRSACCSFGDRKSTRLNSSHANISYAVFCLKKKKLSYSIYYTQ